MFDEIIAYSIKNKFVIGLMTLSLVMWGIYSLRQIPIDAVPDITNNQVMIITKSPTLATQEVEQFITTPVELALQNLQKIEEVRSISRFGLSVVTVVFEEDMNIYMGRQLVAEKLKEAEENIPAGLGSPEMAPVSTGLGEIYQYVIRPEEGFEDKYDPIELRTIQDWIVKRQLAGIEGVVEVNTFGGFLKQYEVAIDPQQLNAMNISVADVFGALENSNQNTGGAYIEKDHSAYYIRTNGIVQSLSDIEHVVVDVRNGNPVLVKNVAKVQFGTAPRYGALVRNGEEAVGGKVMLLKGANSAQVTERIKERVTQIQKSLPEGVVIEPYLVRDKLVSTAIGTVKKNLLEGGLIVLFILIIMLGNWRAGLIVASVIPLAMLFAISMMNVLGISANLMSLGAIDFGLVVDGAVIIIESIVHRLQVRYGGQRLTAAQMDGEVKTATQKIRSSAAFGEIIILMVYIPILALVGIEGKMFKPMAQTVMLAITGALILSLTYVPMMTALLLNKKVSNKKTIADRIIWFFQKVYTPVLDLALRFKAVFLVVTILLFSLSVWKFLTLGGEFIPTLEEGDLAMQQILPPGSSLTQSIEVATMIEEKLLHDFHEIEDIVVSIGSAEIPTDPMPVEIGDYTLVMKPKSEWTAAKDRKGMFAKIKKSLRSIPGVTLEFSQPIQLRFNELMTGSKADIAIKLYGQDLDVIHSKAKEAESVIRKLKGVSTVNVEQTNGMPQIFINFKYNRMAQYGLQVRDVNQLVKSSFAGGHAGVVYEGDRRFDLVVRLDDKFRKEISDVEQLLIDTPSGVKVPLATVAEVKLINAPMQISRENANRRIVIGVNVGNTDVESLVDEIQTMLDGKVDLPAGYYFTYGGQFENLKAANQRLLLAVPLALGLIFILLYFTFGKLSYAVLIFTAIPLSAIGGVWALVIRGMPFSTSAGIGFIALFGVAVLNGIVLIGCFNQLKKEGIMDLKKRIIEGTTVRLRPVLMTAAVASFGFVPMAISTSAGAEVQRPLATVVIGGLITATILTLLVLPILYYYMEKWTDKSNIVKSHLTVLFLLITGTTMNAQTGVTMEDAVRTVIENHPSLRAAELGVSSLEKLKELKYNPGKTEISYGGEGLIDRSIGNQLHELRIVQEFVHPTIIHAQNSVTKSQYNLAVVDQLITVANLKLEVRNLYQEIQHKKELCHVYNRFIDMYGEYLEKAESRYRIGVTNKLELLNIQNIIDENRMLVAQVKMELGADEMYFQKLLNTQKPLTTIGEFEPLAYELGDGISANLWGEKSKAEIGVKQAQIEEIKASTKPSFTLGYAGQIYQQGGFFSGVKAGVSLPLFNSNTKKRIEVQTAMLDQTKYQQKAIEINVEREIIATLRQINSCTKGIDFYQNQMDEVFPEMKRVLDLNYKSGKVAFVELLSVLNLLKSNEVNYLDQILTHNKAVNYYQFLNNK